MDAKRPFGDGVVTGYGTVDGRPVAIFSQDVTVFGGSLGEVYGEKIVKILDFAMTNGCPVDATTTPNLYIFNHFRNDTYVGYSIAAAILLGIVLGTLVALAVLLPFDNAIGAPGLPAGSPLIYLTVIALAAALTIAVTSLSAWLLRTAPSQV